MILSFRCINVGNYRVLTSEDVAEQRTRQRTDACSRLQHSSQKHEQSEIDFDFEIHEYVVRCWHAVMRYSDMAVILHLRLILTSLMPQVREFSA